jgi:hypothetical protein
VLSRAPKKLGKTLGLKPDVRIHKQGIRRPGACSQARKCLALWFLRSMGLRTKIASGRKRRTASMTSFSPIADHNGDVGTTLSSGFARRSAEPVDVE